MLFAIAVRKQRWTKGEGSLERKWESRSRASMHGLQPGGAGGGHTRRQGRPHRVNPEEAAAERRVQTREVHCLGGSLSLPSPFWRMKVKASPQARDRP